MANASKDTRKFASKAIKRAILAGEAMHQGVCVTYDRTVGGGAGKRLEAGGSCSCCGANARVGDDPDDQDDWWLVFQAGFCDSDGIFMSRLCGGPDGSGCFPELSQDAKRRKPTRRDEAAAVVKEMLDDDGDGMEALMDDFDYLGMLDGDEDEGDE